MGFPAPHSTHALDLAPEDAGHLARLSHSLLSEALFDYDQFVTVDRRRVNAAQWRHWRQDDDIFLYREKFPSDTNPHSSSSDAPLLDAMPMASQASHARRGTDAAPRILAVGALSTSLDEVLYGAVTSSAVAMRLRAAYTSTGDDYLDGAVLTTLRAPTPSDPFQFLGLKWSLHRGGGLVRPHDFVYLESTGVQVRQDGSGQRVGFHIMHSVELPPSARALAPGIQAHHTKALRGAFSVCYLYHELANGAVDVYMTSSVEPRGHRVAARATMRLTSHWRALTQYAENKKLAWLLETHRHLQPTAVATTSSTTNISRCGLCTKSFKGFTNRNKKRAACQLCSMTVCGPCSVTRTLRSEGVARNSVVAADMCFCKKCIALASDESAREIARQQLWEKEIVRTGRAHTQTALALARRETINGSYLHQQSLSLERDFGSQHTRAKTSVSSDPYRRTTNGTWASSGRSTDTLSIGTLNYRTSSFQDPARASSASHPHQHQHQHQLQGDMASEAGRASTTSSALVLMDDRKSTRRMKALDYLPASDATSSNALVRRSSAASSSMYTEAQDFETESVYSQTSSIAVLDLATSRTDSMMLVPKPLTITEEEHEYEPEAEPRSELEAFYLEQQRQQKLQQQHLLQRQQQINQPQYQHAPSRHPQARRSTMILLDPQSQQSPLQQQFQQRYQQQFHHALPSHQPQQSQQSQQPQQPQPQPRPSRVRFEMETPASPHMGMRDSETLPARTSGNAETATADGTNEQRLSYQMQLWLQMNDLRDTAESAYKIAQRNTDTFHTAQPQQLQPPLPRSLQPTHPGRRVAAPRPPLSTTGSQASQHHQRRSHQTTSTTPLR